MNIGLIGFGKVGQALIQLFVEKNNYLIKKNNLIIKVKYIIKSNGGIYDSKGIDLEEINTYIKENKRLEDHRLWINKLNIDLIINNHDIDTLVELTSTNIIDGEPAATYMKKALINRINVVTGNKGPILLYYKELKFLADKNKVAIKVGCTTGGALPSITGGVYDLAGSEINSIEGILNGTTNYILSKMTNDKVSYEEALKEAQQYGIAEKDPSLDVLGYDTACKILILSNVLMNTNLKLKDIEICGINGIKLDEINKCKVENKKVKLIGRIEKKENNINAYVKPIAIDDSHPLYSVEYKNKGIYFNTDTLGDISIIGGASSPKNAAAAILRDIILI